MSIAESFERAIPKLLARRTDTPESAYGTFVFVITGEGGGTWTVHVSESPRVERGAAARPDCTIEIAAIDWATITARRGSAMGLFLDGKIIMRGNAVLAQRLRWILG